MNVDEFKNSAIMLGVDVITVEKLCNVIFYGRYAFMDVRQGAKRLLQILVSGRASTDDVWSLMKHFPGILSYEDIVELFNASNITSDMVIGKIDNITPDMVIGKILKDVPNINKSILLNSHYGAGFNGTFKLSKHFKSNIHKASEEEMDNYTFRVKDINCVNWKKIADDLSYDDPLRIITVGDEIHVVVHHTIRDKAVRSNYKNPLMCAVLNGNAEIKPKSIKVLVKQIREIKQAQWLEDKDSLKKIMVTVTKVKV